MLLIMLNKIKLKAQTIIYNNNNKLNLRDLEYFLIIIMLSNNQQIVILNYNKLVLVVYLLIKIHLGLSLKPLY